jgi:hypothetical protein
MLMIRHAKKTGAAALAAMLGPGCHTNLPSAPSELLSGIVVYEDANFLGRSALITKDISDLSGVNGPCEHSEPGPSSTSNTVFNWNDCISSVKVAPGWRATLYRDDGYLDDSLDVVLDVPNLQLVGHDCPHGGLNDCVTSIRVRRQ